MTLAVAEKLRRKVSNCSYGVLSESDAVVGRTSRTLKSTTITIMILILGMMGSWGDAAVADGDKQSQQPGVVVQRQFDVVCLALDQ